MTESAAMTASPSSGGATWIRSPRWDVGWLIGSAAIVPVILVAVWAGVSSDVINMAVTAVIGGPHLFSTYTATYMDPRFRRTHTPVLVAAAVLVPAFVIYWTLVDFQILLSVFIFAASVHVLQQNAYLTDIYRRRAGHAEPAWSRFVDYALLMVCIYPVASYKLVHRDFLLGDVPILIPSFLMTRLTYWAVSIFFAVMLVTWVAKSLWEHRRGVLNGPKTLLVGVTTVIAFLVPLAGSGARLELAFQAINTWHSIQYLGVVWLVQKVRKDRGLIASPFVLRMSGEGRPALYFYGFCFLTTAVLFVVLLGVWKLDPFRISFVQYYYMGVLSCLLIHYVLDGYLFTVSNTSRASVERLPFAAPAVA